MGKKGKGGKKDKVKKVSSGAHKRSKLQRALVSTRMKITRWENNQSNPAKEHKLAKGHKCTSTCRSRHNNWNTDRLRAHAKLLEGLLKKA